MSTQPLGIRVVCDSKRSASCRDYIDTGANTATRARRIARLADGWLATPGTPTRDICPACIEHVQRGEA